MGWARLTRGAAVPTICYVPKQFTEQHRAIIDRAVGIIDRFAADGYDLTLRQLYYQFVAGDHFPATWADPQTGSTNNERSYKKLGSIVSEARRAGLVDWDRIVDRTRNLRAPPAWDSPAEIIAAVAEQFTVDYWADQPYRPEVWVEKDALIGVLEVACGRWHCPFFSCRGYVSDSEAWSAARRLRAHQKKGQTPVVFHLGDHDPSGVDMSRDIQARLDLFSQLRRAERVEVRRLALTMAQVEEVGPPPNPTKVTDSRCAGYRTEYGAECWELDALDPNYIGELIAEHMEGLVDRAAWEAADARAAEGRRLLAAVSDRWDELSEGL
jgi:hypothetical protein